MSTSAVFFQCIDADFADRLIMDDYDPEVRTKWNQNPLLHLGAKYRALDVDHEMGVVRLVGYPLEYWSLDRFQVIHE